jgi:hypothetical protein
LKAQEISLLGALYFEKLIRKVKGFLAMISDRPSTNLMIELTEVSQILACENIDEMDNYLKLQRENVTSLKQHNFIEGLFDGN